ncbi:HPr kinase/phosphorylase [Thermaurantiacus sp.]
MIIHGSCVAVRGAGLLLLGRSGAGKSDLALRLIDRGAVLVADDRVALTATDGALLASPPPRIAGLLEVRGVGILSLPFLTDVPLRLALDLDSPPERMPAAPPDWPRRWFGDRDLPVLGFDPGPPSAALKAELALVELGRHGR